MTGIDSDKKLLNINFNPDINLKKHTNSDILNCGVERIKHHQYLVNEFAKKINRKYPRHDEAKLQDEDTLHAYGILWHEILNPCKKTFSETIVNEAKKFRWKHYVLNPHHIEHWCSLESFKQKNIDGRNMPIQYMEEMCCDWVASSAIDMVENNTTLWFQKRLGKKFIFSEEQIDFILKTILALEPFQK